MSTSPTDPKPPAPADSSPTIPPANMAPDELRRHVLETYVSLRLGIAIAGIALPFILWLGGKYHAGLCLQDSMSAYYHAVGPNGESMRDWFVGILFVIGLFLGLYTGYTPRENWLLNAAGALCVGVAIFPMRWDTCTMLRNCGGSLGTPNCVSTTPTAEWINLHYFCAVTFFLCLGLVCFTCSRHTLSLVRPERWQPYFRWAYYACGTCMAAFPVSAWLLYESNPSYYVSYVFWAEFFAVVFFALYWIAKSFEIHLTASDEKAAEGRLTIQRGQAREVGA